MSKACPLPFRPLAVLPTRWMYSFSGERKLGLHTDCHRLHIQDLCGIGHKWICTSLWAAAPPPGLSPKLSSSFLLHVPYLRRMMTEAKGKLGMLVTWTLWSNEMTSKCASSSNWLSETCLNAGWQFILSIVCWKYLINLFYYIYYRILSISVSKFYFLLTPTALNNSFQTH